MIEAVVFVRIAIIVVGVLLCIIDFVAYCKQKLLDKFAFILTMFGIVLIVVGAVPALSGWLEKFTLKGGIVLVICIVIALWILYSMCTSISVLTYKNQELAIQVSLINSENAQYIRALSERDEEPELVKK